MNALPLQFLMMLVAGWVNRHQQNVIKYLQEENQALCEQLGGKRLRFADQQRRRLGERHLRHAVSEYMEHYHVERNHHGIGNELIDDQRDRTNMTGGIERRERLGGMLNYCKRAA